MKAFEGLGVALITPFDKNLHIDYDGLKNVLEHLYASEVVDYLVVLGSTGEASTLSVEEKQEILSFVSKVNNNRLPLVFGHSGNNTKALVQALYSIDFSGYSAILSASPAYVKPTQEGIIAHYHYLAGNSNLPLILYNVPSRTGSNMLSSTTVKLAEHANIIGIKEASGDVDQAKEIHNELRNEFLLISGDDMLTVPLIEVGAIGLISVLANAYPKILNNVIKKARSGDIKGAKEENKTLVELDDYMYTEGNPTGIKELMSQLGLCEPYVRLPLLRASQKLSKNISNKRI